MMGVFGKVQLDVRDLGGHLDFTRRARAGTLSNRVRDATIWCSCRWCLASWFPCQVGLV